MLSKTFYPITVTTEANSVKINEAKKNSSFLCLKSMICNCNCTFLYKDSTASIKALFTFANLQLLSALGNFGRVSLSTKTKVLYTPYFTNIGNPSPRPRCRK